MSRRALLTAVGLVGGAGLAYEVALTRLLSIAEWHHFAYMILSVALLGFAASATAIALLRGWLAGREVAAFRGGALLLVVALPGSHALAQVIPFETFELLVRPVQFAWLSLLYAVLAVPFFLVSWCITLGFLLAPERVGLVYFANMVGSGLGAAAAVGLLFLVTPGRVPAALGALVAMAFLASLSGTGRGGRQSPAGRASGGSSGRAARGWLAGLAAAGLAVVLIGWPDVRISPYKGLAYALDLPDARVVATEESPVSVVTAVSSGLLRQTPGQISGYPMDELGELPEQVGLYFDADAASAVHRFRGDLEPFAFLDYVTPALPYRLVERPRVLVLGAGGGTEVLSALVHGARRVTAIEVDPSVLPLLRGPLADFSGGLYGRPDVRPVLAEGRGWLAAHPEARFDLIQISLLDSFTASAAGVRALSESYLYTVEAVELYLERLEPAGVLAVTRWLREPPRDAVKMLATLAEAAERVGIERPGRHLAFIRSWNTGTLVLSRAPLDAAGTAAIRSWAEERGFDLAWLPGLDPSEVNRFIVLEEPVYWRAARRILDGRAERERFYRDYAFHVRPATDDRPYFSRFFKWSSADRLLEALGSQWRNAVEWGYVVLVATVAQAGLAAFLVVLLPLTVVAWRERRRESASAGASASPSGSASAGRAEPERRAGGGPGTLGLVAYFGALGLAYLFLEIAFIQKLMLFLAHPVYAVGVVLAAFLVFSGLGSAAADRLTGRVAPARLVGAVVLLLAALAAAYLWWLPDLFRAWAGWSDPARVAASLGLLAPLAFLMGFPFPTGLQAVSRGGGSSVPWAWGVNGAASVVAAPLATLAAVHLGFAAVVGLAMGLYGVAAVGVASWPRAVAARAGGG